MIIGGSTAGIITTVILILLYLWNCVPLFYWWPNHVSLPNAIGDTGEYYKYTQIYAKTDQVYNGDFSGYYTEKKLENYYFEHQVEYYETYNTLPCVVCKVKIGRIRYLDQFREINDGDKALFGYTVVEMMIENVYFDPGTCSFQIGDKILCATFDRQFGKRADDLQSGCHYILFISGDEQFGIFDPSWLGNLTHYMTYDGIGINEGTILYNDKYVIQRIKVDGESDEELDSFYSLLFAPYEAFWREKISNEYLQD